jgi:hypothetical protein
MRYINANKPEGFAGLILHHPDAHFKRKKQVLEDPFLSGTNPISLYCPGQAQSALRSDRWTFFRRPSFQGTKRP